MTDSSDKPDQTAGAALQDSVCFAEVGEDLLVVRVAGRGNFANSFELKRIAEAMLEQRAPGQCRIILDLGPCETMDSTFMGQIASIGLRQRRESGKPLVIVNANAQNLRLMQTLGLVHFTEVRDSTKADVERVSEDRFKSSTSVTPQDKVDTIAHMIEAHQTLCDIDSGNAVRFESVLKYLKESYDKETGKP